MSKFSEMLERLDRPPVKDCYAPLPQYGANVVMLHPWQGRMERDVDKARLERLRRETAKVAREIREAFVDVPEEDVDLPKEDRRE